MQHWHMANAGELISEITGRPVTDRMVVTSCPECRTPQYLGIMDFQDPMRPAYLCHARCGPILIIGLAMDGTSPPNKGIRVGPYLLRNPTDLFIHFSDDETVTMPGNANALVGYPGG